MNNIISSSKVWPGIFSRSVLLKYQEVLNIKTGNNLHLRSHKQKIHTEHLFWTSFYFELFSILNFSLSRLPLKSINFLTWLNSFLSRNISLYLEPFFFSNLSLSWISPYLNLRSISYTPLYLKLPPLSKTPPPYI